MNRDHASLSALSKPYLSLVIPCFNEEIRIAGTVNKIINIFSKKDFSYELIVVDDGCTDKTVPVIEKTLQERSEHLSNCQVSILKNQINRGKGLSVRKGMLHSKGQYIYFTDADLSTPIEEYEKLLGHLENGFNIAIASRSLKDSNVTVRQHFVRQSMGKVFNRMVKATTGLSYADTQCGFKGFDRQAVKKIFPYLKIDRFSFDVEILYLAQRDALKVKEVPVCWENSFHSKLGIYKDSMSMLWDLLRIKNVHVNHKNYRVEQR